MKIYFAGSIRGGREDKKLYLDIIELLRDYGEVLTEHIGDQALSELGDDGPTDEYIYERDMKFLNQSNVVVAEVTQPSLGVGYELAFAEKMNLPVICLYRPREGKRLSAMITGNPYFKVKEYSGLEELKEFFKNHL